MFCQCCLTFLHVCPCSAMKLMTGLVEVALTVSVQLQTTQRQYDMENNKRAHDRASGRLEELQATISEVTHTHKHTHAALSAHTATFTPQVSRSEHQSSDVDDI